MAFFGAIPHFVPALVPGESLLLPVPAELQTPTETSTIVAQNFNVISLFATARIGSIFPIMELRDLFPAVAHAAAAGGNPEVIAQAAEVGPVPICYANYRVPAGAYQLLSANSLIVTLGRVLNLYGTGVNYPARCSLLPVGTDILPELITLPAAHTSTLLMMSEEGIRWMRLTAAYDSLFVGVQDNNLPIFTLPSVLTAPIPGTSSTSLPVTLSVIYGKSTKKIQFLKSDSYSSIKQQISKLWNGLETEDFSITCGSNDLNELENLYSVLKNNPTINVKSNCLPFTAYDTFDKARSIADIIETEPLVDDNIFTPLEDITRINEFTDIVFDELRRRLIVYDLNNTNNSEFTKREFIGPVLVAAIILMDCSNIKMFSERKIVGKFGNGPLDYDIIYNQFHVCVVEAKKENLGQGIYQNIAQLVACRNDFENNEKKRKASSAFNENDIINIPSSGIVSTAFDWIFTRYIYDNELKNWHFIRSSTLPLSLTGSNQETNVACMKENIKQLLKVVCGVLKFQKDHVDIYTDKRRR